MMSAVCVFCTRAAGRRGGHGVDRTEPSDGGTGVAVVRWSTAGPGQLHHRYALFMYSFIYSFIYRDVMMSVVHPVVKGFMNELMYSTYSIWTVLQDSDGSAGQG